MNDKRKPRKIVILLLFCFLQVFAYAQEKTVTGRVTSADGEGLPGATVAIKGTTSGTIADFDGNFTITVPDENAILVFTYVGCTSKEQPVTGVSTMNITLEEDLMKLEEIVVVGYGVSISTLNAAPRRSQLPKGPKLWPTRRAGSSPAPGHRGRRLWGS